MGIVNKAISLGFLTLGVGILYLVLKPRLGFHNFNVKYYSIIDGVRFEGEPGTHIPIQPGAEWGAVISFSHRGSDIGSYRAFTTLMVGTKMQTAFSSPVDVGIDVDWKPYEVDCVAPRGFNPEGLAHCRLIGTKYGLVESDTEAPAKEDTDAEVYHVIDHAEYIRQECRVVEYWADTGGVVEHIPGISPMVRIQPGDSFGGVLQVKKRYAGGKFYAKIMLNMEFDRWEVATGEVTVPAGKDYETFEIPCVGDGFVSYNMPRDRRIQVKWELYWNGVKVLEDRDEEAFLIGDLPAGQIAEFQVGEYLSTKGSGAPGKSVPIAVGDQYGARGIIFKHINKGGKFKIRLKINCNEQYNIMEKEIQLPDNAEWRWYTADIPLTGSFDRFEMPIGGTPGVYKEFLAEQPDGSWKDIKPDDDADCYKIISVDPPAYFRLPLQAEAYYVESSEGVLSGVPPSNLPIHDGERFAAQFAVDHKGGGGTIFARMRINAKGVWNDVWAEKVVPAHADWTTVKMFPSWNTGGGDNFNSNNLDIGTSMSCLREVWMIYESGDVGAHEADWDDDCYIVKG